MLKIRFYLSFLIFIGHCTNAVFAQNEADRIYDFVAQFPLFPGCNEIDGSYEEKKTCSDKEMRKYLMEKIHYPKDVHETGIESKVFIRFVVMPDGTISHIEVAKDLSGGCGALAEASLKAVESMKELPAWTPGYHDGKAVAVRMMMPIQICFR